MQYGPIKSWPGTLRTRGERVRAPFKSGHTETLRLLDRELRSIRAEAVTVQLATRHFRKDGLPYADAAPEHPGVIVTLTKPILDATGRTTKRVPLRFAADRFLTWETNLRAIAIGLEDLRRIDRYGITSGSEQYLGFKALPPPAPSDEAIRTVEDAARFLRPFSSWSAKLIVDWTLCYRDAYRTAALKLHPDTGGEPADWAKLQAAKTLLDAHHKERP